MSAGGFADPWVAAGAIFERIHWPVPEAYRADYEATCEIGRKRMAESRAVLCGLVRDAETDLPNVSRQLERLAEGFGDHRILLYENDSRDKTPTWLEAWAGRNPRFDFVSEVLDRPRHPGNRSEARRRDMADYRSRCQAAVIDRFADFDHVIVVDTDLRGYDPDGVAHAMGLDGWDALAAKGVSWLQDRDFACPDAYAFRAVGKPEPNAASDVHDFVPHRGAAPVPVLSCFGGLALYRMDTFRDGDYTDEDCEHVTFHASLRAAGRGRIFMDPSLLTLYPDFGELYPRQALRAIARRA